MHIFIATQVPRLLTAASSGLCTGGPGVRVSVGQLLEPLSRIVDAGRGNFQRLHLVHRLDKETTGIMLLAKSVRI